MINVKCKPDCQAENETTLYSEINKQYYIVCNKCFSFLRWAVKGVDDL